MVETGVRRSKMQISGTAAGAVYKPGRKQETEKTKGGSFGEILKSSGQEDASRQIREKMEELYDKIRKGETQQSFQIGASSFTLKEWERFIRRFDKGQEELEEMIRQAREMMRARMAAGNIEEESAREDLAE